MHTAPIQYQTHILKRRNYIPCWAIIVSPKDEEPIWRLCGHPCWEKVSLAVASNRAQTSKYRSRSSTLRRDDHKRRVLIPLYIACKMEEFLSLNTLSFLHSHSDQIKAIAPSLICFLNLLSIPLSQFPSILVILRGGNKVEATWITDHIDPAKWYWKNKCFIDSSWWQKTHFLLPCQFRFARLSLVRTTPYVGII
jgi:hypothetical protein